MSLKARVQDDMKTALRAQDKPRLGIIRLIMAAIKQREIDERISLDDSQVLAVLERMIKQRRDSFSQYQAAGRRDLADQEAFELEVIQAYLPQALAADELDQAITAAVSEASAESMRDMGKVMALLKPRLQGRADMAAVSAQVKALLKR